MLCHAFLDALKSLLFIISACHPGHMVICCVKPSTYPPYPTKTALGSVTVFFPPPKQAHGVLLSALALDGLDIAKLSLFPLKRISVLFFFPYQFTRDLKECACVPRVHPCRFSYFFFPSLFFWLPCFFLLCTLKALCCQFFNWAKTDL